MPGGTLENWEAIAKRVMDREFIGRDGKMWDSERESLLIGLRGWPESWRCKQAAANLEDVPVKRA